MKIITTTGFYGTGSSAVTDLLSEYANVNTQTDFEIALLYDYRGISQLYYHLIKYPVRNVSNIALRDFYRYCEYLAKPRMTMDYEKYFHGHFMEYTKEYIEKLGGTDYFFVHYASDEDRLPFILKFLGRCINKVVRSAARLVRSDDFDWGFYFSRKQKFYLHTLDEMEFIQITKEYFEKLFSVFNQQENILIDQLVTSSEIDECCKFFDDISVFLVDRDPRDLFIEEKYRWKGESLPVEDIRVFCRNFIWNREMSKGHADGSNIYRLQFEDLVFRYEETVKKIEAFLGISSEKHIDKNKYFLPEASRANCRLWELYPGERENISYIEDTLSSYLYELI